MENEMNVVVIDPKNLNLDELAKKLGGRVVTLDLNDMKPVRFNPFDLTRERPEE